MESLNEISKILNIDIKLLEKVEAHLFYKTKKEKGFQSLIEEKNKKIENIFNILNLEISQSSFEDVQNSLLKKMEDDNQKLSDFLNNPNLNSESGRKAIIDFVSNIKSSPSGFFLKESKARELLIANPPQKVLSFLGYKTIEEALSKENLLQIFASLRFIEDSNWLNSTFFKKYEGLTPQNFEIRPLKLITLDEKWKSSAVNFVNHKRHNLSHLKELGVIFILPLATNLPGEIMRTIGLLFHYLEEVSFYSSIIKDISNNSETFSKNLTSLLRGDVYNNKPENEDSWLVIQRYLEKDDSKDWRLFWPHINTESLLYSKAYKNISSIGKTAPSISEEMKFWSDLDWVGDIFSEKIISFDFMDVAMSLVDKDKKNSYFYHQHEALWNKIFSSFFSQTELENQARANLLKGFFLI